MTVFLVTDKGAFPASARGFQVHGGAVRGAHRGGVRDSFDLSAASEALIC